MQKPLREIAVGVAIVVIGGVVLQQLTGISLVGWVGPMATWVWDACSASITMPRWLFALTALVALSAVWNTYSAYRKSSTGPSKHDYVEDHFDGLVWRWSYDFSGAIKEPWCFCPACDSMLVYSEEPGDSYVGKRAFVHFTCEVCGVRRGSLEGDRRYIVARIQRMIDRKLRVGEWRAVIESKQKGA